MWITQKDSFFSQIGRCIFSMDLSNSKEYSHWCLFRWMSIVRAGLRKMIIGVDFCYNLIIITLDGIASANIECYIYMRWNMIIRLMCSLWIANWAAVDAHSQLYVTLAARVFIYISLPLNTVLNCKSIRSHASICLFQS